MSDTDDTEILLLIPPNFFRVCSDSDESHIDSVRTVIKNKNSLTNSILDSLITQVRGIETRLDSLESASLLDINSFRDLSSFDTESERTISLQRNFPSEGTSEKRNILNLTYDGSENHTFPKRKKKLRTRRAYSNLSTADSFKSQISPNCTLPRRTLQNFRSYSVGSIIRNANCLGSNSLSNSDHMKSSEVGLHSTISSEKLLIMNKENNDPSIAVSDGLNDGPMLSEIDQFLNRVELFERSIHHGLENICITNEESPTKQYNTDETKIKPSGNCDVPHSPVSYLRKFIYLTGEDVPVGNPVTSLPSSNSTPVKQQEYNSIPDNANSIAFSVQSQSLENVYEKSPAVRKLQFSESSNVSSLTSTPNQGMLYDHNTTSLGSPIKSKIQEKAEKLLDKHRKMMNANVPEDNSSKLNFQNINQSTYLNVNSKRSNVSPKKNELDSTCSSYLNSLTPQKDSFLVNDNPNYAYDSILKIQPQNAMSFNLMSIADLWTLKSNNDEEDNLATKRKFEEERLKREHCESIIQKLQRKHLEQQQKISVAIRIDRAKDEAIIKLKNAWLRLSNSLTQMDSKHNSIMERMTNEMKVLSLEARENIEKAKHYEQELSKALDLAHGYQEKCKQITQSNKLVIESAHDESKKYMEQLKEKDATINELKDSHSSVMKLNKQFSDCVEKLEHCVEKEKKQNETFEVEIETLKKSQELLQNELLLLRQNRDNLKKRLDDERDRNANLSQSASQNSAKVKFLEAEMQSLKNQMDNQKQELKIFYQKQLEEAVLGKLKEFQAQLDEAEKIMANDSKDRQKSIAEAFAKQIHILETEHKREMLNLKDTHNDEVKLYRLQLAQFNQKVHNLEDKLQMYRNKRGQIATQLHQVMENQWQQALRILTAGVNTPSGHSAAPRMEYAAPDDSDTQRVQNLLQRVDISEIDNRILNNLRSQLDPYLLPESKADVRRNHRRQERQEIFTPVSSQEDGKVILSENDMQKYIKILLCKSPSELDSDNQQTDAANKSDRYSPESNCAESTSKERPTRDKTDDKIRELQAAGVHSSMAKPPWK